MNTWHYLGTSNGYRNCVVFSMCAGYRVFWTSQLFPGWVWKFRKPVFEFSGAERTGQIGGKKVAWRGNSALWFWIFQGYFLGVKLGPDLVIIIPIIWPSVWVWRQLSSVDKSRHHCVWDYVLWSISVLCHCLARPGNRSRKRVSSWLKRSWSRKKEGGIRVKR